MTRPFKGILHPKMKILSSFTHPQVVSNLSFFLLRKIFCSRKRKYYDINVWFPTFFKISTFVFIKTQIFIHV